MSHDNDKHLEIAALRASLAKAEEALAWIGGQTLLAGGYYLRPERAVECVLHARAALSDLRKARG